MRRRAVFIFVAVVIAGGVFLYRNLPVLGAGGLLYPFRRTVNLPAPEHCVEAAFAGDGLTLHGWRCSSPVKARAAIIYLHGIADTRTSSAEVIRRFLPRGFDVVAYDGRAHGHSPGTVCTYGYYEKRDLSRVIDKLPPGPVVLIGHSLGAAVALQAAAEDARVSAVVAAETFSDLATVARERAPFVFTEGAIREAFRIAETRAGFRVDEASPLRAAARIHAPVLLLHGEEDTDTPPAHSRRVFDALSGPKRLALLPGVRHAGSLNANTWPLIEAWIDEALRSTPDPAR